MRGSERKRGKWGESEGEVGKVGENEEKKREEQRSRVKRLTRLEEEGCNIRSKEEKNVKREEKRGVCTKARTFLKNLQPFGETIHTYLN